MNEVRAMRGLGPLGQDGTAQLTGGAEGILRPRDVET